MRWSLHTMGGLCGLRLLARLGPSAWAASQEVLPVAKIMLCTSGVGYFQRDGHVTAHAEVPLRFQVDNINESLKSMVVQNFDGGQITIETYLQPWSRGPTAWTSKRPTSTRCARRSRR